MAYYPESGITFTQAFVEAGNTRSLIDVINPHTGRSAICGETLEQVRERYPNAEIVSIGIWCAARGAEQDVPVVWEPTSEEKYIEMLEVLPPAYWQRGVFAVGEPQDHHAVTNQPRFIVYRKVGTRYFCSSRPMTIAEAKAEAVHS